MEDLKVKVDFDLKDKVNYGMIVIITNYLDEILYVIIIIIVNYYYFNYYTD